LISPGRVALGADVGQLLELERALERHRVADVPAEEQHPLLVLEVAGQLAHRLHPVQHLLDQLGIACRSARWARTSSGSRVPRSWAR
jgi:hypothetical protein